MDCTPTQVNKAPRRVPTPKLPERKKKLFSERQANIPQLILEDSELGGGPISSPSNSSSLCSSPRDFQRITSFRNVLGHSTTSPCSEKSLSPEFEKRFSRSAELYYEVLPMEENDSRLSFTNSQPFVYATTAKVIESILDDSNSSSFSNMTLTNQEENREQEALKTPGDRDNEKLMPKLSSKKHVLQELGQVTPHTDNQMRKKDENSGNKVVIKARTSLSFGCMSDEDKFNILGHRNKFCSQFESLKIAKLTDDEKQSELNIQQQTTSPKPLIPTNKQINDNETTVAIDQKNKIPELETKSFYSSSSTNQQPVVKKTWSSQTMKEKIHNMSISPKTTNRPRKLIYRGPRLGGARGVSHKIKPIKKKTTIKNMNKAQLLATANEIINKSALNEYLAQIKAKQQIQAESSFESVDENKYENDECLKKQINRLKKIFKETKNPIEMARPLSLSKSMTELYNQSLRDDSEEEEENDDEEIVAQTNDFDDDEEQAVNTENCGKTNKFFKSGLSNRAKKEFKLVHNLSATVGRDGKVLLNRVPAKKRKLKSLFDDDFEFFDEYREVDDIIKKLDQSTASDVAEISTNEVVPSKKSNLLELDENLESLDYDEILSKTLKVQEEIRELERRLQSVEKQDEVKLTTIPDSQSYEDCQMADDDIIVPDSQMEQSQQLNETRLFPIFYKDQRLSDQPETSPHDSQNPTITPLETVFENARKRLKTSHSWKPMGENQYQIDAGQKNFGARQCDECGFLYSSHEPEDEKLHQQYHESRIIIKYTRWKEEIEVCQVSEWGVNGRIVAYNMNLDQTKLERLDEILAIVDHEMGYYDRTVLPDSAMVYFALLKNTIIGICLVHPLEFAYRLMSIETVDGVADYFSAEKYPVKCGISRIWVTPFSRRMGVARSLISTVKSHFIFAHSMSYDEIAFSSPTESGKVLAESLSKRKDFLVYY